MKIFQILAVISLFTCVTYSCSISRSSSSADNKKQKSKITGVTPTVKNPSRGVINASGDGLTPGIGPSNGIGSEENATNIANNAIFKANAAFRAPQQKKDSLANEDFINNSAALEMMEINISKVAQQKTNNKKIKEYATMSLNDHLQIQNDLKRLYISKNIKLTDVIHSDLRKIKTATDQLNTSADGGKGDFDFNYVQMTIETHQKNVKLFEDGIQSGDPAIRVFAAKYLPLLRNHLSAAQALTTEVKAN